LEGDCGGACAYIQNGIVAKISASVFSSVDVKDFMRVRELLDGEFKPLGIGKVHEVFGRS